MKSLPLQPPFIMTAVAEAESFRPRGKYCGRIVLLWQVSLCDKRSKVQTFVDKVPLLGNIPPTMYATLLTTPKPNWKI